MSCIWSFLHKIIECTTMSTMSCTWSSRTLSLRIFSGGADGLFVLLGGHVKCRTHIGCVSTAVTALLDLLAMRSSCSFDSSAYAADTVHPCNSATSLALLDRLSKMVGSAPSRTNSLHTFTAPITHTAAVTLNQWIQHVIVIVSSWCLSYIWCSVYALQQMWDVRTKYYSLVSNFGTQRQIRVRVRITVYLKLITEIWYSLTTVQVRKWHIYQVNRW